MIVTFTANPSIDRTMHLGGELRRGQFHRVLEVSDQAAGKGMNVATVLRDAGVPVMAVVAFADEAFLSTGRKQDGVDPIAALTKPELRVRTNITVTEPDGTTTKINEPGPHLDETDIDSISAGLTHVARQFRAQWVVMSGSLPPGAPVDWYVRLTTEVRAAGCRVAVDASEGPLKAVLDNLESAPVDLLKPNVDELAQALGREPAALQQLADAGEWTQLADQARVLQQRGVETLLVTLGPAGALLMNSTGAWQADALPVEVRSTVGAGDATLAGYVMAARGELEPADALAYAMAYGAATSASPATVLGRPTEHQIAQVRVRQV